MNQPGPGRENQPPLAHPLPASGGPPAPPPAASSLAAPLDAELLLHRSEERYRLLVENARDYAIFTMNGEGAIVDWNPGAERILGFTAAEIVSRPGSIIFIPEDIEQGVPERELGKAAAEGRAEDLRWHLRKDGSRFWANGVLIALRDEVGKLSGFAKVLRDETGRKQAEEERNELLVREQQAREASEEARGAAEAANAAKDHFIAVISHELRSPLNTILGWTGLLLRGELDQETRRSALETIERNARAQQKLIDDLIDAARIQSGRIRLDVVPVDLLTLVTAALESVRPAAEAKAIHLSIAAQPGVTAVAGDPDRLHQVLLNLLGNAIKFTPRDGRIEVCLERSGASNLIYVQDNGIGIEPEFLPHIFDQYQQAEASRRREQPGLGLGLSIARQMVKMHGGTLTAQSQGRGQGATFMVQLPAS